MSRSFLAFIESNTTGTGRLFAQAATDEGFTPILLSNDPSRYSYVEQCGLRSLRVNTQDKQELFETCRLLSSSGELVGITSSSEYFIQTAASLAGRLGLPGPSPDAIKDCRDKLKQRLLLQEAGIGVPDFRPAESEAEAVEAANTIGLPVVLKPVSGSGSVGVLLCNDSDEVASHAAALLRQEVNERGMPVLRRILVKQFVRGQEFSVEIFHKKVVGVCKKYLGKIPYFIEEGHDFPASLSATSEIIILETALRAIAALDLGWGPLHLELRVSEDGPKVIEVNPRLAGGYIPELVRLACGIDLIVETVRLAAGKEPLLKRACNRCASIGFIISNSAGTLVAADGLEKAALVTGVVEARMYCQPGDQVRKCGDFRDRIGHVTAIGNTPEVARKSVEEGLSTIDVLVRSA